MKSFLITIIWFCSFALVFISCGNKIDDYLDSTELTISKYENMAETGRFTIDDVNTLNREILDFRAESEKINKSDITEKQRSKIFILSIRYEKVSMRLTQNGKFKY